MADTKPKVAFAGPWVFKSKFRRDQVTLRKPVSTPLPDGSRRVTGTVWAEFDHNTWTTKDPELATILRDAIATRRPINPLGIVETTNVK